jgi:hypothetical protein
MPAGERRVPKGDVLFGVFVTRTNAAATRLPSASRIDLLDGLGRAHRPLRLSPTKPVHLRAGRDRARRPAARAGEPRGRRHRRERASCCSNRVPAQQVANGWLELAVHDPLHLGVVDYVQL